MKFPLNLKCVKLYFTKFSEREPESIKKNALHKYSFDRQLLLTNAVYVLCKLVYMRDNYTLSE